MKVVSKAWDIFFCKVAFDVVRIIFYSARGN
jgi:hypothetical protein